MRNAGGSVDAEGAVGEGDEDKEEVKSGVVDAIWMMVVVVVGISVVVVVDRVVWVDSEATENVNGVSCDN